MCRVGQNHLYVHIYTPYMTVYLVISLPKLRYIHRIYIWFWPILLTSGNLMLLSQRLRQPGVAASQSQIYRSWVCVTGLSLT